MFSGAVQSSVLSLFSSTGSDPLRLFSVHQDSSLAADSFVHLLHDGTSLPLPAPPASLISSPSIDFSDGETEFPDYALNQTVLHIQSPTLRTTYIHSPPFPGLPADAGGQANDDLWIKHPWMHVQVRNMGREWSLEVGVVDQTGRRGILRLSTFQVCFILKLSEGESDSHFSSTDHISISLQSVVFLSDPKSSVI